MPLVYIASLSDYNSGNLHGRWVDASLGADHLREETAALLAESKLPGAEEWAIHDQEGFGSLTLSESTSFDDVARLAELIDEHGELFADVVNHLGGTLDIDGAESVITDGYRGEWDSLEDYAANFVEDVYSEELKALPDFLKYAINYEQIGRDFEIGGDVFTIEHGGKVHVFDNNI